MNELQKYTAKWLKDNVITPFLKKKGYSDEVIDDIEVIFKD